MVQIISTLLCKISYNWSISGYKSRKFKSEGFSYIANLRVAKSAHFQSIAANMMHFVAEYAKSQGNNKAKDCVLTCIHFHLCGFLHENKRQYTDNIYVFI